MKLINNKGCNSITNINYHNIIKTIMSSYECSYKDSLRFTFIEIDQIMLLDYISNWLNLSIKIYI